MAGSPRPDRAVVIRSASAVLFLAAFGWLSWRYWPVLFGQRGAWGAGGNLLMWIFGGVTGFYWAHLQSERRHRAQLDDAATRHGELLELITGLRANTGTPPPDGAGLAPPPAATVTRKDPHVMKLRLYPAAILYAVNAVIALVVSTGVLSATAGHYLTTIASAVLGLVVAFTTRPVVMSAISALFTTLITGAAGFGLHLSPALTGVIVSLVSMLAAYFTHQTVSPKSVPPGQTAAEIEARAAASAR